VVALCQAPFLLDDPNVGLFFPADAISKAKHYLAMTIGGLGIFFLSAFSYTSLG
jgi:glutamate--glyoxylate aminotransferase